MTHVQEVKVPDIGGASSVDVIEILVKVGDVIDKETSLITLESDKASMEIPSPFAGTVKSIALKIGDKVSEGDVILHLEQTSERVSQDEPNVEAQPEMPVKEEQVVSAPVHNTEVKAPAPIENIELRATDKNTPFAGPGVRRLAHTLGVDLSQVRGTGPKSRIQKEDVESYVKKTLAQRGQVSYGNIPAAPAIDFSQFGPIEMKPLNKIKRVTGLNMQRSWLTVPHVTQFDSADITELEAFRKKQVDQAQKDGYKLTMLAFVSKVVAQALLKFPQFNASLDSTGEQLIYKNYVNIGIAVETPNGLVVPVLKGVDQMSVSDIAKNMGRLSQKARDKGLMPNDMSGGCFTISSLGGIGGEAFTPIVNSPEVAILGLSRSSIKPVYINGVFEPRLMLPLSLSYDHRVIDGAEAARFTCFISEMLADIRRLMI